MVRRNRNRLNRRVNQALMSVVAQAPMAGATPGVARRRRVRRQRQREMAKIGRGLLVEEGQFGEYMGGRGGYQLALGNPTVSALNVEPMDDSIDAAGGPTSFDIRSLATIMQSLGSTPSGQKWAFKALHPNGEEVDASGGIPDHTMVPVVSPEFRINDVIVGGGENNEVYDVDIIMLPFPDIPMMWRRYKSGEQPSPNVGWTPVFFPTAEAIADYPSVAALPGLKPTVETEILSLGYPRIRSGLDSQYGRLRGTYYGVTLHLDAPQLLDQGRLVAAQLALPLEGVASKVLINAATSTEGPYSGTFAEMPAYGLGKIPLTENDVFAASPGAVAWQARDGVYMPMRYRDPVHMFASTLTEMDNRTLAIMAGDDLKSITTLGTGDNEKLVAPMEPLNFLTGIVLLRGIAGPANVQVKARMGLEAQVDSAGTISPFQKMSPMLDRVAIDKVCEISQSTPMAYPACYNDFGSILNVIKEGLKVAKPIINTIGGLGIPVVSDIAGVAGGIMGQLGLAPQQRRRQRTRRGMRTLPRFNR